MPAEVGRLLHEVGGVDACGVVELSTGLLHVVSESNDGLAQPLEGVLPQHRQAFPLGFLAVPCPPSHDAESERLGLMVTEVHAVNVLLTLAKVVSHAGLPSSAMWSQPPAVTTNDRVEGGASWPVWFLNQSDPEFAERMKQAQRTYYDECSDYVRARTQQWRDTHPDQVRDSRRSYYERNAEQEKAKNRARYHARKAAA